MSRGGARRRTKAAGRPRGEIVSPIDFKLLIHDYITRGGRATRLELLPLDPRYRAAILWRLERVLPLLATPTYRDLWSAADPDRREAVLEAVLLSGDFHYGSHPRERRQILARWLHRRLTGTSIEPPRDGLEQGALV